MSTEYEVITIPAKPTLDQINQGSLNNFAAAIAKEVMKSMDDPEFMTKFEEWQTARAAAM